MYEIWRNTRLVLGHEIETWSREIVDCNILEAEAGTNGPQGGDAGHGSRSFLRITDLSGTCMNVEVTRNSLGDTEGIAISLGGDAELRTFITALRFVLNVFEEGTRNGSTGRECE